MKPLRFEVEWVGHVSGRPVVLARQLDQGEFGQPGGLRLGGRPVVAFDIPRALAPDGSQRPDVFVFTLGESGHVDLPMGAVVELTGEVGGH
jgi:hypothetical protein